MITALVSSVLGLAGGAVPELLKEWRTQREHDRELSLMQASADLQLKMMEAKAEAHRAEVDANLLVEEMRAFKEQMKHIYESQKPTGIKWIDGFNALMRPVTVLFVILMFIGVSCLYSFSIISEMAGPEGIPPTIAADMLWNSLIGEAIQAVLGYLFGYRSSRKVGEKWRTSAR